ncbi:MAG: hypothetical protein JWP03_2967, partial [Phycisphaerales bacterium]|nr:hypothetical protein [Phycisphaerales bacterium]
MLWAKAFVCRRLLPGACLLFVAGCLFDRKPPTPPLVPAQAVLVNSNHFVGTPLTGPLAQTPATVNPANALSMEVTLTAVERVPAVYRGTLGSSARMIVATRGSVPLRPTAVLARSAGFASGINAEKLDVAMAAGKFGRVVPLSHTFTALPAGTT